ncbi:hypothetical protein [Viridibacillus arvi]|uniref:hypothetical protein n=1 Tax=Viridibacillus arvi TaxID=263475 RepID=UPI0034CDBEA2
MSNRKISISKDGKDILDSISNILEIERPQTVKIALAKGISITNGPVQTKSFHSENKWTLPEGIIKDNDYLLFKHLIINEQEQSFDDNEISKQMQFFIEIGLRELQQIDQHKTSLDDFRIAIL